MIPSPIDLEVDVNIKLDGSCNDCCGCLPKKKKHVHKHHQHHEKKTHHVAIEILKIEKK